MYSIKLSLAQFSSDQLKSSISNISGSQLTNLHNDIFCAFFSRRIPVLTVKWQMDIVMISIIIPNVALIVEIAATITIHIGIHIVMTVNIVLLIFIDQRVLISGLAMVGVMI